ncbi:Abi family protein, partial [Brachyspira hyodysenteriae]|uniref:Abi family protein n=1 Tax=Brachyspira hyodysenteriae TaxID=159 RepID=UPI001F52CEFF
MAKKVDNIPKVNISVATHIGKLHTILFNVLEEIEIFIRAKIAYYHAHKYGALGYLDEKNFYNTNSNQKHINKKINYHKKFINNFKREIKNNQKVL